MSFVQPLVGYRVGMISSPWGADRVDSSSPTPDYSGAMVGFESSEFSK